MHTEHWMGDGHVRPASVIAFAIRWSTMFSEYATAWRHKIICNTDKNCFVILLRLSWSRAIICKR